MLVNLLSSKSFFATSFSLRLFRDGFTLLSRDDRFLFVVGAFLLVPVFAVVVVGYKKYSVHMKPTYIILKATLLTKEEKHVSLLG